MAFARRLSVSMRVEMPCNVLNRKWGCSWLFKTCSSLAARACCSSNPSTSCRCARSKILVRLRCNRDPHVGPRLRGKTIGNLDQAVEGTRLELLRDAFHGGSNTQRIHANATMKGPKPRKYAAILSRARSLVMGYRCPSRKIGGVNMANVRHHATSIMRFCVK